MKERMYVDLYFERLSFKKHINYLKLTVNEHMNITKFNNFNTFFKGFFQAEK